MSINIFAIPRSKEGHSLITGLWPTDSRIRVTSCYRDQAGL